MNGARVTWKCSTCLIRPAAVEHPSRPDDRRAAGRRACAVRMAAGSGSTLLEVRRGCRAVSNLRTRFRLNRDAQATQDICPTGDGSIYCTSVFSGRGSMDIRFSSAAGIDPASPIRLCAAVAIEWSTMCHARFPCIASGVTPGSPADNVPFLVFSSAIQYATSVDTWLRQLSGRSS